MSQTDKILREPLGVNGDQPLLLKRMSSDGGLVAIDKKDQGKAFQLGSRRRSNHQGRSLRRHRHILHLRLERVH